MTAISSGFSRIIALSALRLRESLAQVYQLYPKTKDMVLISHSLGGLLSQMQVVTTRRVLWDSVFKGDADRVYAALPPDNVVKRALNFDANPRVARIVFICVPHRGSYLATNWIGSLGIALIRLPGNILTGVSTVITAPLQKNLGLKRMPTGINGLSPQNPLLHGLDTLPIHAALSFDHRRPRPRRYTQQFGRRGALLEFAPCGRPVGIDRARSARFFCSPADDQRVEANITLALGSRYYVAPKRETEKSTFDCQAESRVAGNVWLVRFSGQVHNRRREFRSARCAECYPSAPESYP
jgi:hypothetical protein